MPTTISTAHAETFAARKLLPVKVVVYRGIVGLVGFLDPISWLRYLNPCKDIFAKSLAPYESPGSVRDASIM